QQRVEAPDQCSPSRLRLLVSPVWQMVSRNSRAIPIFGRRSRTWAVAPVRLREERERQATLDFLGHAPRLQFSSTLRRSAANRDSLARERALQWKQFHMVLRVCPRAHVRRNRVPEQDRSDATQVARPTSDRRPPVRIVPLGLAPVLLPA